MEKVELNEFLKISKKDLEGKIFCFPTDTVYGVGCLFNDTKAINKIYEMKKRDAGKPFVNLVGNFKQISDLNIEISKFQEEIMFKNWPGALSVILAYNSTTISFRMPNSETTLKLCEAFGALPTTSVNESNQPELNRFEEIYALFKDHIDYFIDVKDVKFSGLASTVVDLRDDKIKIVRQGTVIL